ncbi:GspH/FimT family pseudopilin [Lysobacter sp. K5869]|uniref:GspH/FimT family pseudopilin n=1 Tax=Lysobacter sp. K5869 TaxID=2820808 RepID=UPI001C060DA5|nr:GspH/FimT family pseudopilin [Lysobacter sp. K5869]QWP79054.1 GspH/FimT family pseudopilin [Lysobacter sp. K5869]
MIRRRSAGFTLIELLVTIGIGAILVMLALPSFTEAIRSNRVTTAANQMLATVNLARGEALRSKSSAHVCPRNDTGTACGSDWTKGMLVWTDENGNGKFEEAEVKRVVEPQQGIQLKFGNFTDIAFDERGRPQPLKAFAFSMQASVCKTNAETRRDFAINRMGQVSMTRAKCQ